MGADHAITTSLSDTHAICGVLSLAEAPNIGTIKLMEKFKYVYYYAHGTCKFELSYFLLFYPSSLVIISTGLDLFRET